MVIKDTSASIIDEAMSGTRPHTPPITTPTNTSATGTSADGAPTANKSAFVSSSSSLTNQMLFTHPFLFDLEQRDTLDTIPYKDKDKYYIVTSASNMSNSSLGTDDYESNDDIEEFTNQRDPPPEDEDEDEGDNEDEDNDEDEDEDNDEDDDEIKTNHDMPTTSESRTEPKIIEDSKKPTITKESLTSKRPPPLLKPPRLSLLTRPSPLAKSKRTKTAFTFQQTNTRPAVKAPNKTFSFKDDVNTTEKETRTETELKWAKLSSPRRPSSSSTSRKPILLSSLPKMVQRSYTTGPGTNTSKKTNSIMNDLKINKPNPKHNAKLWAAHDNGTLSSIHITKKEGKASHGSSNDNNTSDDLNLYVNNMKLREKIIDEHETKEGSIKDKTKPSIFGIFTKSHKERMKEGQDHADCIDCWQILRDECAPEYGFGAKEESPDVGTLDLTKITAAGSTDSRDSPTGTGSLLDSDEDEDDDTSLRQFKILGTGPDDLSAQPHVLSPPLMDSLLNFVPEALSFENLWLKYSLVRDGSCLETFRHYTRASRNTILAIQTTGGDVFGSFTTSPWENQGLNCFGNGESFVWKMRLNRSQMTNQSLYTQAHFESEIDVYPYSGVNSTVQHCSQHMIAIGGTEIETLSPLGFRYQSYQHDSSGTTPSPEKKEKDTFDYKQNEAGFALALHDDLCRGTTSPCPTFCSPSLLTDGGEIFEVENLECWTFTPVDTVNEAQKLEMRKYFVARNNSRNSSGGSRSSQKREFTSQDLIQGRFYRRLGDRDIHSIGSVK